ncbi:hypothetical protein RKE25_22665 (plasmid) [Dyella sp. BiH032]|uniref:hypothetical protein n=1 Tax=Dyella sp. BiH032 TaxID=3075430 RepID=UPI002892E885|nr:hypothetical protein [Dyella sp. BiH032]WNL48338.1 hypothetical protein RKE25_22665 [Dyella sp. BiH032]
MPRHVTIPAPEGFPLFGWTEEKVKEYIIEKPLDVGEVMTILSTHGGITHYRLARVEAVNVGKQRRVVLSRAGSSGGTAFHRSGKNCFMPTGQSRMLPPLAELPELNLEQDVILDALYGVPGRPRAPGKE